MESVNKTLYIPLYGKSQVSKKGIILHDEKAEQIWEKESFRLKRKSKSKWLAYFLAMRAKVFDEWVEKQSISYPNSVVLHLGCGLDSRARRVKTDILWYDIDFDAVIKEREKYYEQTSQYKMIGANLKDGNFLDEIEKTETAIVVMEGVSMYLTNDEVVELFSKIKSRFARVKILVDCYTPFGAKMSKIKNPSQEVGVKTFFGIENQFVLEKADIKFVKEWEITPKYLIEQLKGFEKFVFKRFYGGKFSKKLYKLYEYES